MHSRRDRGLSRKCNPKNEMIAISPGVAKEVHLIEIEHPQATPVMVSHASLLNVLGFVSHNLSAQYSDKHE